MAGTGILQLPYALKTGGWFALLWIFISGFLAYQGGKLTVACLYYDGLNRLNGIIEIGEAAYGKNGKRLVEICFSSLTVGACGLYLILASNNLELVDKWTGLTKHEWIIICTILSCVPFVSIKTLKEAAMLSVFGVITTIVMVVVVLNVAYVDYNHLENSGNTIIEAYGNAANYPTYSWISLKYLPLSLASISFSFGGNSVFSHVEHSMQNPKSFNNVLKWALLFVCFLYSSVAFIGYLAYGNNTVSPIFNNLQPGLAVTVAIIMLTAHVLLAIPINLTSFSIEAEHSLGLTSSNVSPGRQAVYRVAFRMLISIFTCSFAILLPYFDHVMALLGALSNGIIVFVYFKFYDLFIY
ncbi:hypothetical protein K502DRAFT_325938 [Neoconidiobolus thromboides FSU 785]|nr:hypothetical protein K502DRAFT_325938 [Neoconidiobolus thromboides FSU 785]